MRRLMNPFSPWVFPLRLLGSIVMAYGFVRTVAAPDAVAIAIGVLGAVVWQAGNMVEWRTSSFKRLKAVPVRHAMATRPIIVSPDRRIPDLRTRFANLGSDSFFLVVQNGDVSGIALPEDVYSVSGFDARYLNIGQVAHPVGYLDAVRPEDALLEAFNLLDSPRLNHVPVLDEQGALAGVVTRQHIAEYLRTGSDSGFERGSLSGGGFTAGSEDQETRFTGTVA